MKQKKLIFFLVLIAGISVFYVMKNSSEKSNVSADLYAPSIEFIDPLANNKINHEDLKGRVFFINFWASWCQPCRDEMSSIEALFSEMKMNSNFAVITILYRDSYQNASEYLKLNGYTFPVYLDVDGNSARKFGITGVPETYLIDKKGIVRKHALGPALWNSPEEKKFILSMINE
jgi:thiol-disulfide isomerase/thioredoxin